MTNDFLPFALPDIGEEEIAEVVQTLRSGWITTGPKTRQFEAEFASFMGEGVEALAVNSATAGLHLALEAVGVGEGDCVVTTPYTFTATAEVVRYLGAELLFADIDPETLNVSVSEVESVTRRARDEGKRVKAIIPVHFAGLPCRMDELMELARSAGVQIIEDAAHAFPARYGKKLIGTLDTDASVFSFYATKTITTAEGGMLVTRNKRILERCRTMRLHGISSDAFDRYTSRKASWYYEVVAPGYKYNMTDIAASMGIQQLKKAEKFRRRRAEIARQYDAAFSGLPLVLPPKGNNDEDHAWHLYVIRLTHDAPVTRDEFVRAMAERGIGCSVHFIPLHLQPYWRDRYRLKPEDFSAATDAYERAVSLPIYTKMTDHDVERVIDAVREMLR